MEEERRRRSAALQAGRQMLENYRANRSNKTLSSSLEQASDEDSIHNDIENQSMDLRSISNNESISMSEGEGDGELERLAGRVTQLEDILQSREAEVESMNAKLEHIRTDASSPTSSHSQNSNIVPYNKPYSDKVQELFQAINQRDRLIEDLTSSLQQALTGRDDLINQVQALNEKVSSLENNLDNPTDLATQLEQAQQSIKKLELEKEAQYTTISNYKNQIEYLNQKIQSESIEIDDNSFEAHLKQKQCEDQVEKIKKDMKVILDKFAAETSANNTRHNAEMKEVAAKYQAEVEKLKKENESLNTRHAKEISDFHTHLLNYKRTIDSLKLELVTSKESHDKDKELLTEQIKLHKLQLEDMTTKYLSSLSILDSKESIERSLEQALNDATNLRSENESLKFKLDDLTSRYSAAQNLIENNQMHERSLSNKIFSLEKSLSRLSGFSIAELDETAYQTLDEMSLQYQIAKQKLEEKATLEQELIKRIQDLEELVSKTKNDLEMANRSNENYEKQLKDLQNNYEKQIKDVKNNYEKQIKDVQNNYEKQIKDLKNDHNQLKDDYENKIKDLKNDYDYLRDELNTRIQEYQHQRLSVDSLDGTQIASLETEQEITELKKTLEKRDKETVEYMNKLEQLNEANHKLQEESEKLKTGLATAYAQCALFEEKLDQTLGFGDSKLEDSTVLDQTISSNASSLDLDELLHKQSNYNKVLQKLDSCRKQIDDYEYEKKTLLSKIEKKTRENDELLASSHKTEEQLLEEIKALKIKGAAESQKTQQLLTKIEEANEAMKRLKTELEEKHAKEMEELRTYFEQKCLQMEKQYSEEIFSQQSKKMSDNDSEIEELTDDLFVGVGNVDPMGGGGDAPGIINKEIANDSSINVNVEQQKNTLKANVAKITAEYEEKLDNLRKQLQDMKEKSGRTVLLKAVNQFCQTEQSSVGSGAPAPSAAAQESCNELNELRADYNRQLEEQVGLARLDIINALREQIEALLTVESESDENWPTELLELRDKFTNNAKREMHALRECHVEELKRLKEGHNQIINDLQEEIKRIKTESHESVQNNLVKERDKLHKTCATLKNLVTQLIDYFVDCEEELNNTLISEVLRKQITPRLDNNASFDNDANMKIKRVRFAPQSSEITSVVSNNLQDLISSEKDLVNNLKGDLDVCLQRLKSECAKILNASMSDSESWSTGIGDSPSEKLIEAEKLLASFQEENEHLKVKIIELQQRLLAAENKKEVISEGYGEQNESVVEEEEASQDFSQLQDRAKYVVMNGSNDTNYLLQLIDELCRHADKSLDEVRKEKEDLQHQIEAADKQLRSTRKFQEEQAVEREAERDEAARRIQQLQEKLREREREKDRDYRINSDEQSALSPASSSGNSTLRQIDESKIDVSVEGLTAQLRESELKRSEAESELKTAVEKIWELRELIRELEQQEQGRQEREQALGGQIEQLEEIIVAQTRNQQELVQELELVKAGAESRQMSEHIGHLQEELRRAQLSSEQLAANSSALRQLRAELRDLHAQLARKTRELEAGHLCGSSLSISQPSEEVSIREQIEAARCPSPDEPGAPPVLPLEHLLKLKDGLLKHFRVEDVALKRLKDYELQLTNLQRQNEELLAEQELLQQTTSEQLFQIETLRARLEQQKQNAPFAQRQATCRLESQVSELHDRLESAERAFNTKDVELSEVRGQLERVSRILAEKENEIANVVQTENGMMQKLRDKIEVIEEEKKLLQAKLSLQGKSQNNLPQIIDSMLAEKNAEIDRLREQLVRRDKQFEAFMAMDEMQLRDLLSHNEPPKNSARTLSDILSINSDCEEASSAEPIRDAPDFTRSTNMSNLKVPASILLHSKRGDVIDYSQPITETPKVPRLELGSHSHSSEALHSNIEISKEMQTPRKEFDNLTLVGACPSLEGDNTNDSTTTSEDQSDLICPRHGMFTNIHAAGDESSQPLHGAPAALRIQELEVLLAEVKSELNAKTIALNQRETELIEIQANLEQLQENIESLNHDRLFYKTEYEKAKDNEGKIQSDLLEIENELKIRTEELEDYKEKIRINENIFYDETKRNKRNEAALQEKLEEINNLKEIVAGKDITIETLQTRCTEIENENKDLYECRRKFESYQQEISDCQHEIQRLRDGLNRRDELIHKLEDMALRSSSSGGSSPSEKDQEIYHLQEYIKEKDKVIRQMSDDSKSLHRALETIQNKMKESGNIVELRRKLKDERKNNHELSEEIAKLRTELEILSSTRRAREEDNDITEMVQQQLNLSARLDQQLLNVIDSESEDVLKCNNLKQANREIEELTRLKIDLEIEREMLKSQIAEYENRILQLKADIEDESLRVRKLEEDLSKERHLVRSLQMQLQREKNMAEDDKSRDVELISQLRIKLDEAIEVRNRLLMEIKNLEVMSAMKSQNKDGSSELESEQNIAKLQLELTEKLEIERRKYEESQEALKKLEADKNRLQKQCELLEAEIKKQTSSLDLVALEKDQLKSDLQRAKEELKAKTKECDWQKSIFKTVSDAENKRNQQRTTEHIELKNVKRELKNSHDLMLDLEEDMKALKDQIAESAERETQLSRCIESLTDKETELTDQLTAAKTEEKKLRDIIADQDKELKMYLRREIELAEELKRERSSMDQNSSPSKILQRIKNLNATIERLSQDKVHLYEKIAQLKGENESYLNQIRFLETQLSQKSKSQQPSTGRDDLEERLQHFYGKYLRSDSRKKALIYQKQYLLCIIAGYQYAEENTLSFLSQLTKTQRKFARQGPHRRNARVRFRSAVFLVIAVERMKWLILRWRTGRRVGANVVLGNVERQLAPPTRHSRSAATSGHSPPVRERTSNGATGFSHDPYFRRFSDIQQSLHL